MFSYEDRLRAVQLYIKLGKRVGLTIRQPGFPTKNTLMPWYQKYEQGLGLATRLWFPTTAVRSKAAGASRVGGIF